MKRIVTYIIIGLMLMFTGTANAVTLSNAHDQRWADQMKVPTYTGQITDQHVYCGENVKGLTLYDGKNFTIQIHSNGMTRLYQHLVLYHELGHVFDFSTLTMKDRYTFARIWRLHPPKVARFDQWWATGPYSDQPIEQFARVYAILAVYGNCKYPDDIVLDLLGYWPSKWVTGSLQATYRMIIHC